MKTLIITMIMGLIAVTCGCTSLDFGLSQADGLQLSIKGAPPTLYKLVSYDKGGDGPAFDLFHFEAEKLELPEGTGTVLRAEEDLE